MTGRMERAAWTNGTGPEVIIWLSALVVVAAATTWHAYMLCPPALLFVKK